MLTVAVVGGPWLSAEDLAALAASATVDPSVTFDPTIGERDVPLASSAVSAR